MQINLSAQQLPKIYKRKGRDCYLDPIRNKLIFITPEETVRQQVISYLIHELQVPINMISVEENLSHYDIKTTRRTDITIKAVAEDGLVYAIAVIECKAPGVFLSEKVAKQLEYYSNALGCDYAMMINDSDYACYHYNEETQEYEGIEALPKYEDMLQGVFKACEIGEKPERPKFEEISDILKTDGDLYDAEISQQTKHPLACAAFNLLHCLYDIDHKMPSGQYKAFRLIEDYGIRLLTYGNAGGGIFDGCYRSFLIERNGSTEFVSVAVAAYSRDENPDVVKTSVNVAIDNEKVSHHALQLSIDDNVVRVGDKVTFYHSGKIAIGNKGSGKIAELREFVAAGMPQIISGSKFNLGEVTYNRNWCLDDPEIVTLFENLITYALIRDEFREYKKSI